eukprot:1429795-Rhodomonas_salina.1
MPSAQHEIPRTLRHSCSPLGENSPQPCTAVMEKSRSRRTNTTFLPLRGAHKNQVERRAAPQKCISPQNPTLGGENAVLTARLKANRHLDESFIHCGLVLLILFGCGAMHLSVYNPRNFWPAGACVLISGLASEFLSERHFENSRRIVHSKIQTQPTFKQMRRRSSIRRDSFIYRQNRVIVLS